MMNDDVRNILLVEDQRDAAELPKELLQSYGYNVELADSMERALSLALARRFDLLISDLSLPDGSGLSLMRGLKESGACVKGIAVSGYGSPEDIRESRRAGFSDHLIKPIDVNELLGAMARLWAAA
jgi:CheY-like chemotaxis protein